MYPRLRSYLLSAGALCVLAGFVFLFLWEPDGNEREVVIAAGSKNGESYAISKTIAKIVQRHEPSLRITVRETKGSVENIELLNRGEADFATVQADVNADPHVASATDRLRLVTHLYADYYQLLGHSQKRLLSFSDLPGKRIAVPPAGGGQYASFLALLNHSQIEPDELTLMELPAKAGLDALVEGRVDAAFLVRALPNPDIQRALASTNVFLRPIHGIDAIHLHHPVIEAGTIPSGTYSRRPRKPRSNISTIRVPRLLMAREKVPAAVVHDITKVMFEHRWELVREHALAAEITEPDREEGLAMPIHVGAEDYYDRNEPSFLHQHAEPIALILSILAIIGSGLLALKSYYDTSQKERVDRHNARMLDLRRQIEGSPDAKTLDDCLDELYEILETVVHEVDQDRVTSDGFQYFSFTWNALHQAVLDRRKELGRQNEDPPSKPNPFSRP